MRSQRFKTSTWVAKQRIKPELSKNRSKLKSKRRSKRKKKRNLSQRSTMQSKSWSTSMTWVKKRRRKKRRVLKTLRKSTSKLMAATQLRCLVSCPQSPWRTSHRHLPSSLNPRSKPSLSSLILISWLRRSRKHYSLRAVPRPNHLTAQQSQHRKDLVRLISMLGPNQPRLHHSRRAQATSLNLLSEAETGMVNYS